MFNSSLFNGIIINEAPDTGQRVVIDTGTGVDSIAITSLVTIAEAGTGTETIFVGDLALELDLGSGTDSVAVAVTQTLDETGTISDSEAITVTFPLEETGSVTDSVLIQAAFEVTDTATGTDSLPNIVRHITISDTGSGFDRVKANFATISTEGNKLSPDTYVELFDFDASLLLDRNGNAGTVNYFTNTPTGGGMSPLWWRENGYYPLPFEISGVESRGDGTAMARPTIAISNVNQFLLAAVLSLGDLVGMRVTRWRTFYKFTDNGIQPNINMHYPVEEWIVTRKIAHSKTGISFEMSNALDRPGLRLPRKQILTDQGFPGVSKVRLR